MYIGSKSTPSYDYTSNFGAAKLIYIPTRLSHVEKLPALLQSPAGEKGDKFCIVFHGNACDINQVSYIAENESKKLNAHYLLVEYPGYGIAKGSPTEESIRIIAMDVYNFVTITLKVPHSRIMIMGRSIGTGPACYLAAELTKMEKPPAAVILHSPYASIRDLTVDLVRSNTRRTHIVGYFP
jgi:hypothetical protein